MTDKLKDKKPDYKLTVNGKPAELRRALPLNMGDFEILEDQGVDIGKLDDLGLKDKGKFFFYILNKANNAITYEDYKTLILPEIQVISDAFITLQGRVNGPL